MTETPSQGPRASCVEADDGGQIERGDVSTQDVLNCYVSALGGTLKVIADFGDEQFKIA
jgi:hypothetical protein